MRNLRLIQYRLESVHKALNADDNEQYSVISNLSFSDWINGDMGGDINVNNQIYSLQVYGMPGTQFYLNNGLIPIELGPSGYYSLELNDFAGIYRLSFDEKILTTLYNDAQNNFVAVPLVVDAKIKNNIENYSGRQVLNGISS